MLPEQLTAASFSAYPPEARKLAVGQLSILQRLPLAFLPLLLREVIAYDWKFPAERQDLDGQFRYLGSLASDEFVKEMAGFTALRLTPEFESVDWLNHPADFSEKLSAHLWATHQHDAFRAASVEYVNRVEASQHASEPVMNRLALVVIGQAVTTPQMPLFRKLRPYGVHFTNVAAGSGVAELRAIVEERSAKQSEPFAHWYIDGGEGAAAAHDSIACVSYRSLDPIRSALIDKMRKVMQPGGGGSEVLRSVLAQITPGDLGMPESAGSAAVLDRFRISVLTEGSGTQLFSTTFVQWTAREALRRAQPLTLLARFSPRQREESMKELLAGTAHRPVPDPEGSLVDADMGAYYTYLNLQRLSGAERAGFLVWFEDHSEALAIGPALGKAHIDAGRITLRELVGRIA